MIYDVPVTHRTLRLAVQRRFKQLHFGRLQGSAWVSPHPLGSLREILRGIDIDPASFFTLRGRPETGESDAQIVERAWNFAAIARDYDRYLDHIRKANRPACIRADKRWRDQEHDLWKRAISGDPFLPRVLWPKNYRGEQAFYARADLLVSI